MDQEDQLTRRHRGDSTAHVEGTEITLTLKVPVAKLARLREKKHWLCKELVYWLTGDNGCGFGHWYSHCINNEWENENGPSTNKLHMPWVNESLLVSPYLSFIKLLVINIKC